MSNRPTNFDLSGLGGSKAAKSKRAEPDKAQERPMKTAAQPVARSAAQAKQAPVQSGFRTRRNADPLRRQRLAGRPKGEERHQFNVRMRAEAATRFIQMAEIEGVTYGDLVEILMEHFEEGRRGRS